MYDNLISGAIYAFLQKLIQFRYCQTKTNELEELVAETVKDRRQF